MMERCYGCLSNNSERRLQTYMIKKLIFRTILQTDQLVLCYICQRVAVQTEKFIHNVETSQELFADNKQHLESTVNYKSLLHPLLNLSCQPVRPENDIILINGQTDRCGVKHEFEDVSLDLPETVEIKREEQHQVSVTHLKDILNPADFSCVGEIELQENNTVDNRSDQDDDVKCSTDSKKKVTEKDYCAGIIILTRDEVEAERLRRSKEPKYLEATFKCDMCVKAFVMKTPYENHLKLHSKERGPQECDICRQRLKTKCQLENHYRYHIERYRCTVCDETRNCWMSLKDHYLRKHGDGQCAYTCPLCFKQFRFRSSLQKHKSDKHESRARLKCKYCDRTFASDSAISYHLKFNHTAEESATLKPHKCLECGRSFKLLQKLKTHLVTHSDVRNHYCVECDKSFKTRTALNLHFRTVVAHNATDKQQYNMLGGKCSWHILCFSLAPRPAYNFPCSVCGKRFPHKKALSRHTSGVHTNQTMQCGHCGKTFKNKKNLRAHMSAHEGLEPPKRHSCTICNKRFHEKGVLSKHMNTHTGSRPYACAQCAARFAHSGSLYNHTRLVHLRLARRGGGRGGTARKTNT